MKLLTSDQLDQIINRINAQLPEIHTDNLRNLLESLEINENPRESPTSSGVTTDNYLESLDLNQLADRHDEIDRLVGINLMVVEDYLGEISKLRQEHAKISNLLAKGFDSLV